MRIVAGTYGGRRLVAPKGTTTRPTSDRVREAMFAVLGDVTDLDVLDLFAGSGALGLESLSRGARSVTFVETDPSARASLTANLAMVADPDAVRVVAVDWRSALRRDARAGRFYGLCLLDPPYSLLPRITGHLGSALRPVLTDGALVVLESAAGTPVELPDLPVANRIDRTYGGTAIAVMRLAKLR